MLTIRLARRGTNKRPFYDVVVTDSRNPRDGRFVEKVGYFNPVAQGESIRLQIDNDRVNYWLGQGAQASERVADLVKESEVKA